MKCISREKTIITLIFLIKILLILLSKKFIKKNSFFDNLQGKKLIYNDYLEVYNCSMTQVIVLCGGKSEE